jgi:anti-sigma factor RsiW
MNPDLLNILSHSNKDIDNQKLMDYLSGKLSEPEKQQVEQLAAGNALLHDALEGLQKLSDQKKLEAYVNQLNKELHQHIQKNSRRLERRRIKEYPWIYLAAGLVLLFCILGYLIIRMLHS